VYLKRYYLLTAHDGSCFRTGKLQSGAFRHRANVGQDVVSQNIWECAATPDLAVMKNPLHAQNPGTRLFTIDLRENRIPQSVTRELKISPAVIPAVSPEQKLAFAMYVVRQLAPEHEFSHWVERWLSRIDRSSIGTKLAIRSLIDTAEEVDISIAEMSELGFKGARLSDYHDAKYDFLWRAYDVVEAAMLMLEKPNRWHASLSEKVATCTQGALEEEQLADLADVAMHVAAEPNVISYISTPQKVLRSERDVKNRSSYSVFELSDTGLLIEQFDDAQQGGR
jgi:hypothetical protein